MNYPTTTQIETLSTEAATAGDLAQVAICTSALAGDAAALAECARVIADAQAQDDAAPAPAVRYPSAESLDTGGYADYSGYSVALYLVPASESADGIPAVVSHEGVGNIGTPMPAYHGRWASIGNYGPGTVGESVFDALQSLEDVLIAASGSYQGATWDGHNHVGSWADLDGRDRRDALGFDWADLESQLRAYWHAGDYYEPNTLAELCQAGGHTEEDLLRDDYQAITAEIATALEDEAEAQGEAVEGTLRYLTQRVEDYRAEQAEEEAAADERALAARARDWISEQDDAAPIDDDGLDAALTALGYDPDFLRGDDEDPTDRRWDTACAEVKEQEDEDRGCLNPTPTEGMKP